MSDALASGSLRALTRDRRLVAAVGLGLVGRFGYAVLPLPLLFTIARSTGSFPVAAAASATFGFAGLAVPVQARLVDRFGQRRVLPATGGAFTLFLLTVVALALRHTADAPTWVALCLGGGLVTPLLGPSTRAQWREVTDEETRPRAYAVDAVAEEAVFFLGPVVGAALLAVGPACVGVVVAAAAIRVGALGLATSPSAPAGRPGDPAQPRDLGGPLRHHGFRLLLVTMCVTGLVMGATLNSLAALANQADRAPVTGVVEAVAGVLSMAGGAWWGRWSPAGSWRTHLAALLVLRVPLLAACVVHPSLWVVAVAVTVAGVAMAPTFVVAFTASDAETEPRHHTEASTWVTTLTN